jgi:hypothetical protein
MSWQAGKVHFAADALSCYPIFAAQAEDGKSSILLQQVRARACDLTDPRVHTLALTAPQEVQYQQIVTALQDDNFELIKNPSHPAWVLKTYWDSLSTVQFPEGTLIAMGVHIFVPLTDWRQVLNKLHKTHQGAVKTKLAAKEAYFWPGMNKEKINLLESCETCQTFCKSKTRESENPYIVEY